MRRFQKKHVVTYENIEEGNVRATIFVVNKGQKFLIEMFEGPREDIDEILSSNYESLREIK
jgi:hypothetical protein